MSEDITTEVQHVEPRCLETNSDYDQRWFVRAMLMIDGGEDDAADDCLLEGEG